MLTLGYCSRMVFLVPQKNLFIASICAGCIKMALRKHLLIKELHPTWNYYLDVVERFYILQSSGYLLVEICE